MNVEVKVTFNDNELEALKTLANVDCSEIDCADCPFEINAREHDGCVKHCIRNMLIEQEIDY